MKKLSQAWKSSALWIIGACLVSSRPAHADQWTVIQTGECIDEAFRQAHIDHRFSLTAQEGIKCVESTASPEKISDWCEWAAGRGDHREDFRTYVRENTASDHYPQVVAAVQAKCAQIRQDLEEKARLAQLEQKRKALQDMIDAVSRDLKSGVAEVAESEAKGDVARTRFDQYAQATLSSCMKDDWCREVQQGRSTAAQLLATAYPESVQAFKNNRSALWAKQSFDPLADSLNGDWTGLMFLARCHSGFVKDITGGDGRPTDAAVADADAIAGALKSIEAYLQEKVAGSRKTIGLLDENLKKWGVKPSASAVDQLKSENMAAAEQNLTTSAIRKGDVGFEHCQAYFRIPDLDAIK